MKKDKIVTKTQHKIIIRWNRISEALSPQEVILMNQLLQKIQDYDKSRTKLLQVRE